MQGKLVGEMAAVCQAYSLDPENLEGLMDNLIGRAAMLAEFHKSLVDFFKSQLKMQE